MVRRSLSLLLIEVALVVGAFGLVACSDPSPEQRRRDLADDLVAETDGALDDTQATCVADGLFEAFDESSLDRVVAVAEGEEDDEGVRTKVIDVFTGCDALAPLIDN